MRQDDLFRIALLVGAGIILLIILANNAHAYTNEQIADAIYKAEGGKQAKKPYGILSVPCDTEEDCRAICINTIKNNRKRYADYGHTEYETYLGFLSSRYAPIEAANDPQGLNKNWLKNVEFFLKEDTNE